MLPQLEPFLSRPNLIVAEEAVDQFETLLELCGGPKERNRWKDLHKRLKIYKTVLSLNHANFTIPCMKGAQHEWMSERVLKVEDLTSLQHAVFGLGDHENATTITCNSKLVSKLKQNGIHLVTFEHRAVWLTGL